MPYRSSDDLDAAIITLAAEAYDLSERDLEAPGNAQQLRAVALAILHRLDERAAIAMPTAVAVLGPRGDRRMKPGQGLCP
jgi:hypothetical protein